MCVCIMWSWGGKVFFWVGKKYYSKVIYLQVPLDTFVVFVSSTVYKNSHKGYSVAGRPGAAGSSTLCCETSLHLN